MATACICLSNYYPKDEAMNLDIGRNTPTTSWSPSSKEVAEHDVPTNYIVLELIGVVQRGVVRPEYRHTQFNSFEELHEFQQDDRHFEQLSHLKFVHPNYDMMPQWFNLGEITDIQLARPVALECLWHVWFWQDGMFDPNNYMMSQDSAQKTMEAWLSHITRI
jgi:hypothetical protein